MSLTEDEREVVETLVSAYKKFFALPQYHPSDQREFVGHLHSLQNIVMARVAVRTDSDIFYGLAALPESPIVPLPESMLQRLAKSNPNFPPLDELHEVAKGLWKTHCIRTEEGRCAECGGTGTWTYRVGVELPRPWHERNCSMKRDRLEWLEYVRWAWEQSQMEG